MTKIERLMERNKVARMRVTSASNDDLEEALVELAETQSDIEEALIELANSISEVTQNG